MTGHVVKAPLPAPLFNMNTPPETVRARILRTKHKAVWRNSAYYFALIYFRGNRIKLPLGPSNVQVCLPVPDCRSRDPHNYEVTVKPIVDGLVTAGVFPDDSPDYVTVLPTTLEKRKPPYYTITITPRESS